MAVKKYVVRLSAEERAQLDELISKGKRSAQLLTKARILLKADVSDAGEGWSDSRIAAALDISIATIERTRRQLVEEGFEAVLRRKYNPNSARPRIFDGAAEAKLIALTLSPAPEGFARWSLRLLEEKVVELHIVERASDNTIGRTLKKTFLKPHLKQQWVIPPDASAAFVANMEDVLEVYQRPHDPQRPLVCLDETSKQLIVETRAPIPAKPGRKARHDYEYERNGVANLFMVFAPLEGWRLVKVTDRHTAIDYAHMLRDLSDVHFPDAAKIALVQDNLNTHKPASLYEAFPAAEARRLVERFEWHYTPKHGSWLNMAESELGVLASQCLDRRIADKQILTHEVNAWQRHRNKHHAKANWQFTTADARVKLKRLYPQFG
ncbi:MAG: IS630 family transposase, partial [Acidobacteria bacterium Pan2503]|nr:IS630 family transposase [Candidatus Acidoferrum panamensis]